MKKKLLNIWKFLTYDIWRITESEVNRTTFSLYNVIKTFYLCISRFTSDRLVSKASALTYSTLLAIIPILAVVLGIARGFGFSSLMEAQLKNGFGGNTATAEAILKFINTYLSEAQGGLFLGVGLVLLLWAVINLIINIEITFNRIWGIKKGRSLYRKITDYFSMLLLLPILIVITSGLSVFMTTMLKSMENFVILAPIMKFLIRLIPFVLIWFMFTGLYIFMPNTKVKFKHAFVSGILVGTAYQAFQYLYIDSQIWVSRYNAIYGSFAALPLFLFWLQISWTICLFGVQLTYAGQNIENYSFDKDTRNISRRYRDFVTILILSFIVKRFEKNEPPCTASMIASSRKLPLRLTNQVLSRLQDIELIHEVAPDNLKGEVVFLPSVDINQLNVSMLLERLESYGSEDFKLENEGFNEEWVALIESRREYYKGAASILLKDL